MTASGPVQGATDVVRYPAPARPALRIDWPTQPGRPGEPVRLRDRWCFPAVFLIALLVFTGTDTGRMIFDTKLGVDIDPAGFLARLWSLWDPLEWFGTLHNQYAGYAVPMAPFYLLGHLARVPAWLTERLWLALLVTVGFAGLVKLARALAVGADGSRLLAGAVFALWPTFTIVIGSSSAAALPGLLLPWTVLPLTGAVRGRPAGRAVALSGLAVTAMGGVNAASTGYVLVLPALFILIQARGRARVTLLAKWVAAVLAATAWWLIPLLLQGRFNFLPYIEQSGTTFRMMSAAAFLRGAGNWTAYLNLGTPWLSAGWTDVTRPAAILASAVAAAVGLCGLARLDMPARRWLTAAVGLASALALTGYWGPLGGPLSGPADTLFNGVLAPLRSLYKIEPVVAVALALGGAHAMSRWMRGELPLRAGRIPASAAIAPLAALVLAGLALPQLSGQVLQPGSFSQVPGYWDQTAAFLAAHSPRQTALVVPADAHGLYRWGDPVDDPLEALADSPWAERGLVPYGGAGSQIFLDTAEQSVESGAAVPGLPAYLARAGIRYVVVRNDLNPSVIGYVSPQLVNQALARSGFERAASFGPLVTSSPSYLRPQPLTPGPPPRYPAVEVFQAANPAQRPASPVSALPVTGTVLVNGGPDSLLALAGQGVVTSQPAVIAGDPQPARPALWAVTDGQPRADNAFSLTDQNLSFTYTATETNPPDDAQGSSGGPPRQLLPVPAAGHQTVAVLSGAAQVTASSYGYWLGQEPQYDPVNAFDGDPATAWAEASPYTPAGQWIQIGFTRRLDLPARIGVNLLTDRPDRAVASQVQVSTAAGTVTTSLAGTGAAQTLRVPPGVTSWLRITITGASGAQPGAPGAGFTSVTIPGVRVTRYLRPAQDPAGTQAASAVYSFHQQAALSAAADGPQASPVLARTFAAPAARRMSLSATAVATPGAALDRLISGLTRGGRSAFQVTASSTWDSLPRYGPDNLVSSGSGTPWIASAADPDPLLRVTWPGTRTISELRLSPAAGAAFPASVEVASPQGIRLASVGRDGVARLVPPLRTSQLSVTFLGARSLAATGQPGQPPVGLSKLTIPGLAGLRAAVPVGRTAFRLACGQGPPVAVDGRSYPTSVSGTVADLIKSRPVRVRPCTAGGRLALSAGRHWLLATPTSVFTVTDLNLATGPAAAAPAATGATATGPGASGGPRSVQLLTWQPDNRSLRVGPGAESYLDVHENFNDGWTATLNGRPLAAVRLDGWQQSFVVPAGLGGVIRLAYAPAVAYHAALVVSAAALAVLVALALGLRWPSRRFRRRGRRLAPAAGDGSGTGTEPSAGTGPGGVPRAGPRPTARPVAVFAPLAVVIGLAGGPVVIAVPALACVAWRRPRWLPPIALAAMLAAGLVAAATSSPTALGSGAFSGLAQACALVALAAALMPAVTRPAPGPAGSGPLPRAPFGLVDELCCYYDTAAEPNNVHLEVLLPGPVDYQALRQAAAGALAAAPRARGRMAAGRRLRRRYAWEFPPVTDVDPLSQVTWSDERELAAARTRFLASAPPLRTSPPVRLLLASGPNASCVILNAHHAALDGLSSLNLLRDIAARYHAATGTGCPAVTRDRPGASPAAAASRDEVPPAAVPPTGTALPAGPPAGARPHAAPPRAPGRADRRLVPRYPVARIAPDRDRPGPRAQPDGYGLRLLAVPAVPRLAGGTVNDALIAALVATISRWNTAHGRPRRAISITVPVNVRSPGLREAAGNHSRTASVVIGPRTAAGELTVLLAAVTRQGRVLRHARPERPAAGALAIAPGWCPVALKRLAVRFALRVIGPVVCDTCMLTNLGNVTDPPWSGPRGPVRMAFSGPAHLPRGVSVAAVTADGQLQLAVRYRNALFGEAAATRFAASYVAALGELVNRAGAPPRAGTDSEGDTGGPAGSAAQDPGLPGRQGLPAVLRRRRPAVQPAAEAPVPDRAGRAGDAGRAGRTGQ